MLFRKAVKNSYLVNNGSTIWYYVRYEHFEWNFAKNFAQNVFVTEGEPYSKASSDWRHARETKRKNNCDRVDEQQQSYRAA